MRPALDVGRIRTRFQKTKSSNHRPSLSNHRQVATFPSLGEPVFPILGLIELANGAKDSATIKVIEMANIIGQRASGILIAASISLSTGSHAAPASQDGWTEVPIAPQSFNLSKAPNAVFEERDGRDVLCLDGEAFVRDVSLRAGSIAVDIANDHHRHFANIIFRAASHETYETAYLRMHKSGQPDAVQYTPHLNGETNWQLFQEAQASATFGEQDWLTLQLDFAGDTASISIVRDGTAEHLLTTDLTLKENGGEIGLRTLFEGCFSNLRYSNAVPDLQRDASRQNIPVQDGRITEWSLSESFPINGWNGLGSEIGSDLAWITGATEPNGRLLISRYRRKSSAGGFEQNALDGVYAGVAVHSETSQDAFFSFDVSDMATVFLNGRALYTVNNSFRAKGPLFRGDFDASKQTLRLPLVEGRNELIVLVAERANGWGLAGSVAADSTVNILPIHSQ